VMQIGIATQIIDQGQIGDDFQVGGKVHREILEERGVVIFCEKMNLAHVQREYSSGSPSIIGRPDDRGQQMSQSYTGRGKKHEASVHQLKTRRRSPLAVALTTGCPDEQTLR